MDISLKTLLREDGRLICAQALARINALEKVCTMVMDKNVPIGESIRAAMKAMDQC